MGVNGSEFKDFPNLKAGRQFKPLRTRLKDSQASSEFRPDARQNKSIELSRENLHGKFARENVNEATNGLKQQNANKPRILAVLI